MMRLKRNNCANDKDFSVTQILLNFPLFSRRFKQWRSKRKNQI